MKYVLKTSWKIRLNLVLIGFDATKATFIMQITKINEIKYHTTQQICEVYS